MNFPEKQNKTKNNYGAKVGTFLRRFWQILQRSPKVINNDVKLNFEEKSFGKANRGPYGGQGQNLGSLEVVG